MADFPQHPIDINARKILGAASSPLYAGATVGDYLVIPPPPASTSGVVQREVSYKNACVGLRAYTVGASAGLIYKAENGREALVGSVGAVGAFSAITLAPTVDFIMSSSDRGVYVRISGVDSWDIFGQYADIRGLVRTAVDVTAVDPAAPNTAGDPALAQLLLMSAVDDGALVMPFQEPGVARSFATIMNFDDVGHNYRVYLSNGTDAIEITSTGNSFIAAGASDFIASATVPMPVLPEGWSLKMSLAEAVSTIAPRVIFGYQPTNDVPVLSNQGGAY